MASEEGPCELIDGEVVPLSPGGYEHSLSSGNIFSLLREFVSARKLGRVLTNEVGVHVSDEPPRTRGADVAYVSYKRLPRHKAPKGFLPVPPDLIVEVFGSDSSWQRIEEKIADYHRLGVDMVWVADPYTRTVKRFPRGGAQDVVHDPGEIDGGEVLPGFKVSVSKFFDEE